jgi:parvulin-like peptidyl-prolyl isomerase
MTVLKRIKNGEPISGFSFSSVPMPGSQLPVQLQDEIFHLEPGQMTGVLGTPIGFYIVKLVERNSFNHFKVRIIVQNSLQECQQILKRVKAGVRFESHISEKDQISIDLTELPEPVQRVVPGLELKEVSQPIATPFGYFLVKIQERWSDAEIISAKLIRVNSEDEGNKLYARIEKGLSPENAEERLVSGKDLPAKLRDAAKKIKNGEYSYPIKTRLGYYLVKVEKRARIKYKPYDTVKEDIKMMIWAETVSDEDAHEYYLSHLKNYRKPAADYYADIILSETLDEADNILIKLEKKPAGEHQDDLFVYYQQDLKNTVAGELLPADCLTIARQLDPGQLSPVIDTHLGYFILRLIKIEDPAYLPFELVRSNIKSILALQLAEQMKQKEKRRAMISITSSEEESLAVSYYRDYLNNTNTVTDEEAEEWWQNNSNNFLAAMGIQGVNTPLPPGKQQEMMFKKKNVLSQRHRAMVEDLYIENDVVIFEHLLDE